jgi:hypothetical protein
MNLVTPKAGAKHELLFNKPGSESHYRLMSMVIADDDVTFNHQTNTQKHAHTRPHAHTQTRDNLLKGKNQYS